MPLDVFRAEAKRHLESIIVSVKSKTKVVTRNVNKTKCKGGYNKKVQLTPRGSLHNETIYGSIHQYVTREVKVGAAFTAELIALVSKKAYREALAQRLEQFGGDPKKAFTGKNSLEKNPIYLNESHTESVPQKVKLTEQITIYPIRKAIDKDLKVDKVIDVGVRRILQQRLDEFGGDPKKAFVNLDENPIWLNKEAGISIKRVTITGIANATALRTKKDQFGKELLNADGKSQPVDFVNTGNNHHLAVFVDADGKYQEHIVSFYEATARASMDLPIIDRQYRSEDGWKFLFSLKQNEYVVFPNPETGFNPHEIDLLDPANYNIISPNLFRVQKFSTRDYWFRNHLETTLVDNVTLKNTTWKRIQSIDALSDLVKVRVNHIGQIVSVNDNE